MSADLTASCALCEQPVEPHAPTTWKRVQGWVGGPRKDSMRLREDTGEYAHDDCVQALSKGQVPGQPDLFDDVAPVIKPSDDFELTLLSADEKKVEGPVHQDFGNWDLADNPNLEWRG